jgi:hypothetical protein
MNAERSGAPIGRRARILARLDMRAEAAARTLARAESGQELAVLDRQGRIGGGAKYEEGRFAALRECRRAVAESAADAGNADLLLAVDGCQDRWRKLLAIHEAKGAPSLDWVAYAQGGCDGCVEAAREMRRAIRDENPTPPQEDAS